MAQRADAQRNYRRILEVAESVVEEQGTDASLRDVARRAEVGLGTLYRHFPTRDALLETLLRQRFAGLAARAQQLRTVEPSDEALTIWLREFMNTTTAYRGLAASLMGTMGREPGSALYQACKKMQDAAADLLRHAQQAGYLRADVDGTDLFALINAITWIGEQTSAFAARRDHLFVLIMNGLKTP
jgi:AcrR family transcriptional regulator